MSVVVALPAPVPPFAVRRFTVDEYHRMIDSGILTENDEVELLDGCIVPKMPRNPPHDAAVDQRNDALRARLPAGWRVRVQSAITLGVSEPEPDLAVVSGPANRYAARHPGPADIALLVEVGNSTLGHDREVKGRLYAQAGIAVYWVVNLIDMQVEVYTDPAATGYRTRVDYRAGQEMPLVVAGQEIARLPANEFLP